MAMVLVPALVLAVVVVAVVVGSSGRGSSEGGKVGSFGSLSTKPDVNNPKCGRWRAPTPVAVLASLNTYPTKAELDFRSDWASTGRWTGIWTGTWRCF